MKMRRQDREIKTFAEIVELLNRCDTIRLGLFDQDYPYVVPLSFGFDVIDGKIHLYFHGAKTGRKHDLIRQNHNVCVEADICHRFAKTEQSLTCVYESVIGVGKAELIKGDEAANGLARLVERCGFPDFVCRREEIDALSVYRIILEEVTGKRRTL